MKEESRLPQHKFILDVVHTLENTKLVETCKFKQTSQTCNFSYDFDSGDDLLDNSDSAMTPDTVL